MANLALVAAAIIVPIVAIGVGGGYWYYKADRVVDEGTAGEYGWRVQRKDMKYIAEVRMPAREGFAAEPFKPIPAPPGSVIPVELWDTPEAAKAKALEFIAIAAAAPTLQQEPAGQSFQESTVSVEMTPPTLAVVPIAPEVAFMAGV